MLRHAQAVYRNGGTSGETGREISLLLAARRTFSSLTTAQDCSGARAFPGQPVRSQHVLTGYRTAASIKAANDQLQHFVELLEGEGCVVRRPEEVDFNVSVKTPDWEVRLRA